MNTTISAATYEGDLYVADGATLTAAALTTVGGNLDVRGTLTAAVLATVEGDLDVRAGGTLNAPLLVRTA